MTYARIVEHDDGSLGVVSSTGQTLGNLVVQVPDDGSRTLGSIAAIFTITLLSLIAAFAIWHAGRFYEREYGIDVHQSRFSR